MDSVEGVVLAAGLSTRSGQYKMAMPLGDATVIEHSVASMYPFVSRVIVVVGWKADVVRSLLGGYAKVDCVANDDFRAGMFSSVKVGISQVRAARFFLLPGDQPLVKTEVYEHLLAATGDIIIPSFKGRKGHPVLFDAQLIPEILDSPDDATLRDYIWSKGCVEVEMDQDGILLDIDTPEDYQTVLGRYQGMTQPEEARLGG